MTGRAGLAAAAAVVLALAVLTAGVVGPAPREPTPRVAVDTAPPPVRSPAPSVRQVPPPQEQAARFTLEVPAGQVMIVGLVLALALVTAILIRLRRSRADDEGAPGAVPPVRPAEPGNVLLPDLGPLQGAVEDAVLRLAGAGPASSQDAVIACWLRLEEGAAAAGAARRPAQTPTEFTAAVLAAATGPGDAGIAVHELLRLYHQARFGSRPLDDDAAERASTALDRIRAGLAARSADGPVTAGPAALGEGPGR